MKTNENFADYGVVEIDEEKEVNGSESSNKPDENNVPDCIEEIAPGKIVTRITDPEVAGLLARWQRGSLDLDPFFQRWEIWDDKKKSLLILSVIEGIPIPQVYLWENAEDDEESIDGKQRLISLFRYIENTYPLKGVTGPSYTILAGKGGKR